MRIRERLAAAAAFISARIHEPSTYAGLGAAIGAVWPPFTGQGVIVAACAIIAFLLREGTRKEPAE